MEKSEVKQIVKEVLQNDILPQFMELLRTSEDRLTGYRNELHSAKVRCEAYEKRIKELEQRNERLQSKYDEVQGVNYHLVEKIQVLAECSLEKKGHTSSTNVNVKV